MKELAASSTLTREGIHSCMLCDIYECEFMRYSGCIKKMSQM